jgi:hypothetical protein
VSRQAIASTVYESAHLAEHQISGQWSYILAAARAVRNVVHHQLGSFRLACSRLGNVISAPVLSANEDSRKQLKRKHTRAGFAGDDHALVVLVAEKPAQETTVCV